MPSRPRHGGAHVQRAQNRSAAACAGMIGDKGRDRLHICALLRDPKGCHASSINPLITLRTWEDYGAAERAIVPVAPDPPLQTRPRPEKPGRPALELRAFGETDHFVA